MMTAVELDLGWAGEIDPFDQPLPINSGRKVLLSAEGRSYLLTMRVTEIFHSIQGESSYAGLPCVFVRLTGCPLRCSWCDSEYTFHGGTEMALEQVMSRGQRLWMPAGRGDRRRAVAPTRGLPAH